MLSGDDIAVEFKKIFPYTYKRIMEKLQPKGAAEDIQDIDFALRGIIDLLVKKGGKWHIYDYKSNTKADMTIEAFEEHLKSFYASQMDIYRFVVHKLLKCDIEDVDATLIHLYQSREE